MTDPLAITLALVFSWVAGALTGPFILQLSVWLTDVAALGWHLARFPQLEIISYRAMVVVMALFAIPFLVVVGLPTLLMLSRSSLRSSLKISGGCACVGAAACATWCVITSAINTSSAINASYSDLVQGIMLLGPQGAAYGALAGWCFTRIRRA